MTTCSALWRASLARALTSALWTVAVLGVAAIGYCWPGVIPVASAQEGRQFRYGETVEGRITQAEPRQVYYFQARRGDVISLALTRVDGNLDPVLLLAANTGEVMAVSDDADSAWSARIDTIQIPDDNYYFVVATRFGQSLGTTEGAFRLDLQRVGVSSRAGVFLNYGDSVIGSIDDANPRVRYLFEARRGDILNITMQRIAGNLDARVAVMAPDGSLLAANDDRDESLDAAINDLLILEPGFYMIVATRFGEEAGQSTGSYVLCLDTAPTSGQGATLESALLLRYGEEARGLIDRDYPLRYYSFGAMRGDVVTVAMTRASGDLDPLVAILKANGAVLVEDDDSGPSNNALIQSYIIPETGRYYVLAARFDREQGVTSGEYTLRLDGVTGEAPVVAPGTLTILPGSTVTGIIGDEASAVTYAFLARDGDVVTIEMTATDGDLDPLLLLFSAESVQLAQDDDSGPGKNARIAAFSIPADGTYYVIATRYEFQNGQTRGSYQLSLTRDSG